MDYTKSIGSITELQCMSKFIDMGFDCSIPYGDACKYDFIADVQGELLRIQCKSCINPPKRNSAERDMNAIMFYCVAQTTNANKTVGHSYTSNDIDYFATYYQGQVYLIPVEECSASKTLRFAPPQNGNSNYNKAEDYLIENILGHRQDPKFIIQKEQRTNNVEKEIEKHICVQCGVNEVYEKGGICRVCSNFNQRKVAERPSREELKNLIRKQSFLEIGRLYGVSDNSIRKWCKAEKLPTKKSDIKQFSDKDWDLI